MIYHTNSKIKKMIESTKSEFLIIGAEKDFLRFYHSNFFEGIDNEKIKMLRNGQWQMMTEPINYDRPVSGVSLAASFAYAWSKANPDEEIGLIPCAEGGSSLNDWHPEGITGDDAVEIARAFQEAGVDLIDVSTGQTTRDANPIYGRMFQTPYADRIRNEVGMATMAVGNIFEADHVNSIIAAGRADLCALGRPHLADPYWTLHAAAQLGYTGIEWPVQYLPGKSQLERNLERA